MLLHYIFDIALLIRVIKMFKIILKFVVCLDQRIELRATAFVEDAQITTQEFLSTSCILGNNKFEVLFE